MFHNDTFVRPSLFLDLFLPQHLLQRLALYAIILCVMGCAAGITVVVHEQSNRVLLVSTGAVQQPAATSLTTASTIGQGTWSAANALVRINQLDLEQYVSLEEFHVWSPSTCSATSMTEVINAYQGYTHQPTYRITDILRVEAGLHEITPQDGLLEPTGIDRTVAQFHFAANWLGSASIDDLIAISNAGWPVIVDFPPDRWPGGHILVVRGGNSQYVHLADSSRLNMQYMTRTTFTKYWAGFAVVITPKGLQDRFQQLLRQNKQQGAEGSYNVQGKPTIAADFINQVLAAYRSPAQGKGQTLYDLGVQYGIDPAFALAFFLHESTFGTMGEARTTLSLGNLRCIPNYPCVDQDRGGYAQFANWEDGFRAWYALIRNLYVDQWGLTTVDQIIPRYAPTSDSNDEAAYISSLKHAIDTWHAGQLLP